MSNVWQKSDKYAVFMLLWMISGAVVTSELSAVVFLCIAVVYAVMSLYHAFKGE